MNIANSAMYLRNRLRQYVLDDSCVLPADKTFYKVSLDDVLDMIGFLEDLILVDIEIETGRENKTYRLIEGGKEIPMPKRSYETAGNTEKAD